MLDFKFISPTQFVFGRNAEESLVSEASKLGSRILLHYGGGSIKKSGLYDRVKNYLAEAGADFVELGGVKPNPSLSMVRQGIDLCRAEGVTGILAVGGGSVIDSAKAIAIGVPFQGDVWDFYTGKADAEKVLLTDAVGTTFGAVLGTSTVTTYIESAAGIEEGGRTGMTPLVTGFLFLAIGLFIAPLAGAIPAFATAPALVIVGYYMLSAIREVDFADHTEAIPAFLVLITIPYTYSIADGIGMGFISYAIIKALSGRGKEVHPLLYILAGIFVLYFLYLGGVF